MERRRPRDEPGDRVLPEAWPRGPFEHSPGEQGAIGAGTRPLGWRGRNGDLDPRWPGELAPGTAARGAIDTRVSARPARRPGLPAATRSRLRARGPRGRCGLGRTHRSGARRGRVARGPD